MCYQQCRQRDPNPTECSVPPEKPSDHLQTDIIKLTQSEGKIAAACPTSREQAAMVVGKALIRDMVVGDLSQKTVFTMVQHFLMLKCGEETGLTWTKHY